MAYLIVIFVVIVIIDFISLFVRSFVTDDSEIGDKSILSVLLPANLVQRIYQGKPDSDQDS